MITLGDLTVFAPQTTAVPPKLAKAFAVIGGRLRGTMLIEGFRTKDSCILGALTVRDFLMGIGFHDARVLPVTFMVRAIGAKGVRHALAVGEAHAERPGHWTGHLVTVLRDTGWLIDPTLEQAQRPQWPMLTPIAAAPLRNPVRYRKPDRSVAGFTLGDGGGEFVETAWICKPSNNRWQQSPDSISNRRAPIVAALTAQFPSWEDQRHA